MTIAQKNEEYEKFVKDSLKKGNCFSRCEECPFLDKDDNCTAKNFKADFTTWLGRYKKTKKIKRPNRAVFNLSNEEVDLLNQMVKDSGLQKSIYIRYKLFHENKDLKRAKKILAKESNDE